MELVVDLHNAGKLRSQCLNSGKSTNVIVLSHAGTHNTKFSSNYSIIQILLRVCICNCNHIFVANSVFERSVLHRSSPFS